MNKLIPLEFNGSRIMTTKVLADEFGTEEKNIQMNFTRNSKRFIEGKHFYRLDGQELRDFKDRLPTESREPLKYSSHLILWTEKGAARHAKILETDEAWEVYEELEENYFRAKVIPTMSKELQAILMIDQKQIEMGNRVTKLENTMTIDYGQQEELYRLTSKVVVALLGGKDTPAYKELSKKAFSQLWKDYKRVLQVNSYKNTAVKDITFAKKVITDWKPPRELELMIAGANRQIRM